MKLNIVSMSKVNFPIMFICFPILSLALICLAVSIATGRYPLVVGIPNEVVCSVSETHVSNMEMVFTDTNVTLATANRTSRISTTIIPNHSLSGREILCRAYTDDGLEFENTKILNLAGIILF